MLISDKTDFKPKLIRRGREEHCILIQRKIYQEASAILNVCAPNTIAPMFVKETLFHLKVHSDPTH